MSLSALLPLQGCRIVYTRSHAHYCRTALLSLGAVVDHVPLMDTRSKALSCAQCAILAQAEVIVFTSAAAVEYLLAQSALPPTALCVAIGQHTAAALNHAQLSNPQLIAPPPYTSEALLAQWFVRDKNLVIIAAEGGRTLLAQTLSVHNRVQILQAYERFNPSDTYPAHLPLPHAMFIASLQTFHHLLRITPQAYLKLLKLHCTMVAISPRVAQSIEQEGFLNTLSAPISEESSQIEQVCQWWQHRQEYKQ